MHFACYTHRKAYQILAIIIITVKDSYWYLNNIMMTLITVFFTFVYFWCGLNFFISIDASTYTSILLQITLPQLYFCLHLLFCYHPFYIVTFLFFQWNHILCVIRWSINNYPLTLDFIFSVIWGIIFRMVNTKLC